jgi:hypothetical protein
LGVPRDQSDELAARLRQYRRENSSGGYVTDPGYQPSEHPNMIRGANACAAFFLAVPAPQSDESPWRIQRLKGMNEYEHLRSPVSGGQFPQSPLTEEVMDALWLRVAE